MAQRLSGEPNNSKFDSSRPEKEVTTTTKSDKTYLDTNTILTNSSQNELSTNYNEQEDAYELVVNNRGHICEDNSTLTPLGIDGVFTGDWKDTLDYSTITIGINSDEDSATDGLEIQWSADGIIVNDNDVFTISANQSKVFTFSPARRYFRISYTNGGVAQTIFNIQSILRRTGFKSSSHRIQDSIIAEDDAELMKAVLSGESDDGTFKNVPTDLEGRQKVNSLDYLYSIAEGDILGHDALLKFGTRSSVVANTMSTVWEGTPAIYPYLVTAEQLQVVSTDANDTLLGTGARTITLIGLDTNYNELEETINMNGLTQVTTTNSFVRINRAFVATVGTFGGSNIGTINILNNAGTTTQALITIGDGQTLMTMWTVPVNKTAYILALNTSTSSNKGARVSLVTRELDGGILYPFRIRYRAYVFSGTDSFIFRIPFKIPEKTDIEVRVLTPTSAGTTSLGSTFELWYED